MTEKDTRSIYERLHAVMTEVTSVAKKDINSHQKFNFRGVDAVVNAVGPAMRVHGVLIAPEVLSVDYAVEQFGSNRTSMGHVQVKVKYTFFGLQGDSVEVVSAGEATDSGDKATAKAMSVAFRTALLQTLCLPTDEPDPDQDSYERAPAAPKAAPTPKQIPASPKPALPPSNQTKLVYAKFINVIAEAKNADELTAIRGRIVDATVNTELNFSEEQLANLRELYSEKLSSIS